MFCIAKSHTKFRVRLKNFKSVHKSIKIINKNTKIILRLLYTTMNERKGDCEFTIIDPCISNAELRKREVYCHLSLLLFSLFLLFAKCIT